MIIMQFSQHLGLRQKQELALKPKMLQSLKMLALPILELESYIKQELESNPLLEIREEKDEETTDETTLKENRENAASIEDQDGLDSESNTIDEVKELTEILDQWNEYHYSYTSRREDYDVEQPERQIVYEEDGRSNYLDQLNAYDLSEAELDFCNELLDSCDSFGFLPQGYDIAAAGRIFKLCPRRAEELHQLMLHLSPKGITALDISQSLLAQLSEEQRGNHILVGLVTDQFDNLIHRRYQKLASHFGVSEETILMAKEQVARLDPKPGLRIQPSNASYVFPDLTWKLVDGEYVVILNDQITPNIIISPRYRKLITRGFSDRETLSFVRSRVNSAKFLIKSIHMRMRTLEKVSLSIIKHQKDFFYSGTGILKPLTYSVIAQDVGVNESTISRVVSHKYAETPYGIFPLKDFFTSTAGLDQNFESISRQHVKSQITLMVECEDKDQPLSDQDLMDKLKEQGITVSRRIVAKYRQELGILNSRLRRS